MTCKLLFEDVEINQSNLFCGFEILRFLVFSWTCELCPVVHSPGSTLVSSCFLNVHWL